MEALQAHIRQTVLKEFTEQAGEKVNAVIRRYIQTRFYDQYSPEWYQRTYQLLRSVTTARAVPCDGGYEVEVYLDPDKARYVSHWSDKVVESAYVFRRASEGYHGDAAQTDGRFMDDAAADIQRGKAYNIVRDFKAYLKQYGLKVQ